MWETVRIKKAKSGEYKKEYPPSLWLLDGCPGDRRGEGFPTLAGFVVKGEYFTQCRFQSRFTDVLRILPYCDEARFFDNGNGFVEVAEYRNGELIPRVPTPPRWLLELMGRV